MAWWHESGTPVASSGRVWASQEALHILGARQEDAGRWECRVNNAFGEQRVHASLQVTAPLAVHVTPHLLVVNSGEAATFNCTVSGSPVASVEWLHNAEPLPAGRARLLSPLVLHVTAASRAHRGVYQCVARGNGDSAQASAELRLGDTVPELQWTFVEQALSPGPPVSLRCAAAGSPPPQFTWRLDGRPLNAARLGHRYAIGQYVDQRGDVISHVNISSVRVQDGGLYSCSATNSMGTVFHEARLNVYGPPYVRPSAGPVRAVESGQVTLRCPYAGYPISGVSWERRGSPLAADLRHELRDGGASLRLLRVDAAADAGAYVCKVRGASGDVARGEVLLSVTSPPVVTPFFFPTNLREGGRTQISCTVSSGDLPIRFSWLKDNSPIPKALQVTEKHAGEFYSFLAFSKLSADHTGTYTCVASNNAASANHSAQLQVNVSPRWLIEPKDTSALAGSPVTVHCQVQGFPQPIVSWLRGQDGKASDFQPLGYMESHMVVLANGTLSINPATSSDEGFYLCRADNGIGAGLSKIVQLNVNEPARFDVMEKNVTALHGDKVVLKCDIKGDHPINVDWLFNGQNLHHSYRMSVSEMKTDKGLQSQLVITQTDRLDSGLYMCHASNSFGHSEQLIHLAIQEPPDPPIDVKVIEVNSRSIHLAWRPPFDGHSSLTGYLIQYKQATNPISDWQHTATVNVSVPVVRADITSKKVNAVKVAVISDLHPATTYNIRMLALNDIQASDFTEPLTVKTQEEAPVGPPLDVQAATTDLDEVLVTWKPPIPDSWNGDILGYIVHWNIHGSPVLVNNTTNKHIVRGSASTELRLKRLKKFTRYNIYVQAFNAVGSGPKSAPVAVTTPEGVPEAPPLNVTCSALSSQSMKVSWGPPPAGFHGGIIRGYKVVYKPVISDSNVHLSRSEVKRTPSLETYLHGLLKYTNYSVRLSAYTDVGEGASSNSVFCNTEQDVPGPPAGIKALSLTSDSVLVSWLPPKYPNGIITQYTVYCKKKHHPPRSQPVIFQVSLSVTMHEVRGLKELEQYDFWVTASTVAGEGDSTRLVSQAPNSRAPARIASFSQILHRALKSSVTVPCIAVGNPTPNVQWLRGKQILHSEAKYSISQGSLHISKLEKENEGNFSCTAKNLFGEDQVRYQIIVLMPPQPPQLEFVASDHHNIKLQWSYPKDGGTPVLGYLLKYKRDHGSWQEVHMETEKNSYTLQNLDCGATYYMLLKAHNIVGESSSSSVVNASTKGNEPEVPSTNILLSANATSLYLNLPSWPDGGCSMLYFVIEYRALGTENEWMLVDNNSPPKTFLVGGLQPATWYQFRITAHNSAGSTRVHFNVATTTVTGATVAPMQESQVLANVVHFYEDPYVMVPTVCATVLLLSSGLLAYVAIQKKHCQEDGEYKEDQCMPESPNTCKAAAEMENKKNFQQIYLSSPSKANEHHSSKQIDTVSELYEMSPYATFAVSSDHHRKKLMDASGVDHTLQFKTFGHSENESCTQHEFTHQVNMVHWYAASDGDRGQPSSSLHRKGNMKHRHNKSDTCQHSDTETSGSPSAISSYKVPIKHPTARSLELYHLDSSTESNETSPLPQRRRPQPVHSGKRGMQPHASVESYSAEDDGSSSVYQLQPPSRFSDSRELSEAECDLDISQLDRLLARFLQQKEQERMQHTIHV
ncbi:Down syndrome cell adhesion molecule-like protein Dscam2 [Schistocerca nitens]|uniref:Down syndrome cell adhesion molecule-like protein Dscam2 n=1 Tax=Schistocerca nitens TaxID=7011 RepID=UPI002118488C|nr:Down syndrome cell adhesion molecule-like protein Dscam2 [Schistocerca nitens]